MPWPAAPFRGAPAIAGVIDHFARPRNVVGLKGGGRIGHVDLVVDPEFVARAGLYAGYLCGKPAVFAAPHGVGFFQQQIDAFRRRRPQSKRRAVGHQPYTELPLVHAEPAKASTERGGAFASLPDAKPPASCLSSAVFK